MSLKSYKNLWFAIATAYFAGGYLFLSWFNSMRSHYFNMGLAFEKQIPFIPLFIFGYILVYLSMTGLYFLIEERELFKKTVISFFAITTVHYIIFLLLPVKMLLRPVIPDQSGILELIVRFYFWIDMPYNCFPSLHVAYSFLAALVLLKHRPGWSVVYMVATLIVSVSVVLVKQHYIIDVVGGYITTTIVYLIVFTLHSSPKCGLANPG